MLALRTTLALMLTTALLGGCRTEDGDSGSDSGNPNNEESSSIYGTWVESGDHHAEILMFIFFEDGTYLHAEYDAEAASDERSGMEWGTLSLNDDGVATIGASTFDGNGDWGLTDFVGTDHITLTVDGDDLTLDITGGNESGDSVSFKRLESSGASGSFLSTDPDNENELLAFTFLPGGTYCHFEYDETPGEEINGMECSDYTLDANDVLLHSASDVLVDNNGDTGLTDAIDTSHLTVTFTDDAMTLTVESDEESGTFTLDRIP